VNSGSNAAERRSRRVPAPTWSARRRARQGHRRHTGDLEFRARARGRVYAGSYAAEKVALWPRWRGSVRRRRGPYLLGKRASERCKTSDSLKADIDYPVLQRILLEPASHLPYLADAFATLCRRASPRSSRSTSAWRVSRLAVATGRLVGSRTRRWIAEAVLRGMRTIAGEVRLDRRAPTEVSALDRQAVARALAGGRGADLLKRAPISRKTSSRERRRCCRRSLCPNRSDLRLNSAPRYVNLQLWFEALEQLRVADYLVLPESTRSTPRGEASSNANKAYDARFLPPDVPATRLPAAEPTHASSSDTARSGRSSRRAGSCRSRS